MPLMPGLSALVGEGVVFDKPGGRFIESLAAGDIPADDISAFYADMLPQLGWQQSAEGNYLREGENLSLDIQREQTQTIVRFTVSPAKG